MRVRFALVVSLAFLAFFAGLVLAGDPKAWVDPDAGRPEPERRAAQEANSKAFFARYESWIAEQNANEVDWGKLPAYDLLASYAGPSLTLADAVARAERWVSGEVQRLTFLATGSTEVELLVEQGSADAPGSVLIVEFPGGLYPDENWAPTLGIAEAAPLVFKGDKVTLLLERDPSTSVLTPEMWTGVYLESVDGRIDALDENPFAGRVETGTADAFVQSVMKEFMRTHSTP